MPTNAEILAGDLKDLYDEDLLQVARVTRNKDIVAAWNADPNHANAQIKATTLGARISRSITAVAKNMGISKDAMKRQFEADRRANAVSGVNQHTSGPEEARRLARRLAAAAAAAAANADETEDDEETEKEEEEEESDEESDKDFEASTAKAPKRKREEVDEEDEELVAAPKKKVPKITLNLKPKKSPMPAAGILRKHSVAISSSSDEASPMVYDYSDPTAPKLVPHSIRPVAKKRARSAVSEDDAAASQDYRPKKKAKSTTPAPSKKIVAKKRARSAVIPDSESNSDDSTPIIPYAQSNVSTQNAIDALLGAIDGTEEYDAELDDVEIHMAFYNSVREDTDTVMDLARRFTASEIAEIANRGSRGLYEHNRRTVAHRISTAIGHLASREEKTADTMRDRLDRLRVANGVEAGGRYRREAEDEVDDEE